MLIIRSTNFKKRLNTLPDKLRRKTMERLRIFEIDEYDDILNNHPLRGEYEGCRSINITSDYRLIYEKINDSLCELLDIGTHGQLYE